MHTTTVLLLIAIWAASATEQIVYLKTTPVGSKKVASETTYAKLPTAENDGTHCFRPKPYGGVGRRREPILDGEDGV